MLKTVGGIPILGFSVRGVNYWEVPLYKCCIIVVYDVILCIASCITITTCSVSSFRSIALTKCSLVLRSRKHRDMTHLAMR